MLYELTEKNIREKCLGEDDWSRFARHPVKVFRLSDFPYSEGLKNGNLPAEEHSIRTNAIYASLRANNLAEPSGPFSAAMADAAAGAQCGGCLTIDHAWNVQRLPLFQHFDTALRFGFEEAEALHDFSVTGSPLRFKATSVFPGVLSENILPTRCSKSSDFFVMSPRGMNIADLWSRFTHIPNSLMARIPDDGYLVLFSELHEMRHTQQIRLHGNSDWAEKPLSDYYCEIDADMAARAILRKAGVGQDTINAFLHMRYLSMVAPTPSQYWFAASLEALEAKKKPKDFYETERAVLEIRYRIALHMQKQENLSISSRQLQNAIGVERKHRGITNPDGPKAESIQSLDAFYGHWGGYTFHRPALLYTALRQIVQSGAFTDSFSEQLASRILRAASSFNPRLILADYEPGRWDSAERMAMRIRAATCSPM